jgi:hypothetical protein
MQLALPTSIDVHNQYKVIKSQDSLTRGALETLIMENGGAVVQHIPEPSPSCVVIASKWFGERFLCFASRSALLKMDRWRLRAMTGISNKHGADSADSLLPDWVTKSVEQGRPLSKTKR